MFEESLMESNAHRPARRGWSTLMAMALQISALAAVFLFQLLHPAALPSIFRVHTIEPPISSPPSQAPNQHAQANSSDSNAVQVGRAFIQPSSIPTHVYTEPDTGPPPMGAFVNVCHGDCEALPGITGVTGNGAVPVLQRPKPTKLVISHLDAGQILSRVQPVYPVMAKATHTEGTVVLHAIIGRDGRIEDLRVISGQTLLNQAALEAVHQWKFRPYVLNGYPIEVETQIMVNFRLSQ